MNQKNHLSQLRNEDEKERDEMERRVRHVLGVNPKDVEDQTAAEFQRKLFLVAESIEKKLKASLKPKGFYNIPELLDERRLEYLIPNGAFESQPGFDKVYIWQLSTVEGNTYTKGGSIIMPDNVIAAKRHTAPRGVLVAAGLKAMDALYSSGFEIGHIVRFKKMAPFIQPVDTIEGHELTVMVVRDGDIVSSEDLATNIHSRKTKIVNVAKDKNSYDYRYETDGVVTGEKIDEYYDPSY